MSEPSDLIREYANRMTAEDSLKLEQQGIDLVRCGYDPDELQIVVRPGPNGPTSEIIPKSFCLPH